MSLIDEFPALRGWYKITPQAVELRGRGISPLAPIHVCTGPPVIECQFDDDRLKLEEYLRRQMNEEAWRLDMQLRHFRGRLGSVGSFSLQGPAPRTENYP